MLDLYITLGNSDSSDDEEIAEEVRQLSVELNEVEKVEHLELVRTEKPPSGAKGLPFAGSTLLLKLAEAGSVSTLISVLGSWLSRDKKRTIKLQLGNKSLELTGISQEEQQELVNWFQLQSGLRIDG